MTREPNEFAAAETGTSDTAPALPDWRVLGARIRTAAMVSASLHLIQAAGGRLDGGAAVETPRVLSGG
ncbi:MAG TPA: hypothetical protein VMV94_12170 [Phycisphaerae bacterium]|nr:hypothetical protein [Phycisphaerae bacterium]